MLTALLQLLWQLWVAIREPILAHKWWPPSDKPTFAVGTLAAVAASAFAALTYRLNRAQGTPILRLHIATDEEGNQQTEIENIGKGPALNTCFTGSKGELLRFIGSVGAGERRRQYLGAVDFEMHSKYQLYYHDAQRSLLGRRIWRRSTVYRRALGSEHQVAFVSDFAWRVRSVPSSVRRETTMRTPWEHLQKLSAWYDPRNWIRRARAALYRAYRVNIRRWRRWRERDLVAQFADELASIPAAEPSADVRNGWPIDVSGSIGCGGGADYMCYQRRFTRTPDADICAVKVGPVLTDEGMQYLSGIIEVTATARDLLPENRDDRSEIIWQRLSNYFCRYRPNGPFVLRVC
jgi:hypothetical protein